MAGINNTTIVSKALQDYKATIVKDLAVKCGKYATALVKAAIDARRGEPNAHDFTGNLLNSIVVCVYQEKNPLTVAFAANRVAKAIQVKMRKRARRSHIFNPDYSGASSKYKPTVQTNGGWGVDDAIRFFDEYRPDGNNLFDIVVAYPVEYASFVEMERGTTGIVRTHAQAGQIGMTYLKVG